VDLQNLSQSAATAAAATTGATPGAGGLENVTLAMAASGTYPHLMDYVNRLNQLSRTMVVDNLTLSPGTGSAMTAQITGRMFFVPAGS
jgi:hypothetical protein